jgi:hypothetical protein
MLLYSAKERAELAFRKEIDELTRARSLPPSSPDLNDH